MSDWLLDSDTGIVGDWIMSIWLYAIPLLFLAAVVGAARTKAHSPESDGTGLAVGVVLGPMLWPVWILVFAASVLWAGLVGAFTPVPAPAAPLLERLEPRDGNDPFCTCPSCDLVGAHWVEVRPYERITYSTGDGDTAEIVAWGAPLPGTPLAYRTCVFCGHSWTTAAGGEGSRD